MRRLLSPVAQFALSGLLVVLVVAVVGVLAVRHISRNEALRDAKQVTELAGNAVVAPAIEPGVLDENPAALAKLDRVVRFYVLRDPVVRVKLWDESGRIVYSDEPRLIGKRFALEPDERELFRRPGVHADVSDLTRPENRFEKGRGPLREVYLGIRGPRGQRLLFETYLREGAISAESRRVWRDVIPIVLGVLLALWLVQIPLGWRLSRRLQRAQHQAVTASEHERRRLARDLHDGVVQDLVAVSLTLGATQDHETGAQVRRAIRRLRTLLVELYPDDLHRQGLRGRARATSSPRSRAAGLKTTPGRRTRPRPRPRHRGALLPHRPRGAAQRRRPRAARASVTRPRHPGRDRGHRRRPRLHAPPETTARTSACGCSTTSPASTAARSRSARRRAAERGSS